jgi:hypothetical protein
VLHKHSKKEREKMMPYDKDGKPTSYAMSGKMPKKKKDKKK